MADATFNIKLNKFYRGLAPTWLLNAKSSFGNAGQANAMTAVDVLDPTYMTQGKGLADATGGSSLSAAVNYIMDKAVSTGGNYAVGGTKLYEMVGASTLTSDSDFPHTITNATSASSCAAMGGYLYYFYKSASGDDIGKHTLGSSTFDDDWGSTTPTGFAYLQDAIHPVAVKETLMVFGNGRYLGLYDSESNVLSPTKLDFGDGAIVSDVIYHKGYWWVAVTDQTYKSGARSQIYLYDASGTVSVLADEVALEISAIGFLKVVNGTVFLSYTDTAGSHVGYLSGKSVRRIGSISSASSFNKKTIRQGVLLCSDGSDIYAVGSVAPEVPLSLSKLANGDGQTYITALGGPSGTNVARYTGTSYSLAYMGNYSAGYSRWTSLIFDMANGDKLACIDKIIVLTKSLGTGAACNLYVKTNQEAATSAAMSISTAGKRRHVFKNTFNDVEDFRIYLDWSVGSATNDCAIREIQVIGHWKESI